MRIPYRVMARRSVLILSALILTSPLLAVVPFNVGDVFAGVGRGKFNHFSPTGTLLVLDWGHGARDSNGDGVRRARGLQRRPG